MSADIAARIADYFQRQAEALRGVERDWERWAHGNGALTDDDLCAIEAIQERHMRVLAPLQAEFRALWKEWEHEERSPAEMESMRQLSREVAEGVSRVRDIEEGLSARIREQMKQVAAAGDAVRRGRKMTRGYGGVPAGDAGYIDHDA
jgi:hypothetical protein